EIGSTVEVRPAPVTPRRFSFYIDIFGYCNLRCPSCPVGNWEDDASVFHHGAMSRALLETILDKAMAECTVAGVALFNWTEPLLHAAVHELIGVVRARHSLRDQHQSQCAAGPGPADEREPGLATGLGFGLYAGGLRARARGRRRRSGEGEYAPPRRGKG